MVPIEPLSVVFFIAIVAGGAAMLGLLAFPWLARSGFLLGLFGLGAAISLESVHGVGTILARALTEASRAMPPGALLGLSVGMLLAVMLASFLDIKRR